MKSGGLARLIALALILVAVGLSLPAGRSTGSPQAPPSPSRLQAQPLAVFRGSPSCAATACHGAQFSQGAAEVLAGTSTSPGRSRDKHASAREVLFSRSLPVHRGQA